MTEREVPDCSELDAQSAMDMYEDACADEDDGAGALGPLGTPMRRHNALDESPLLEHFLESHYAGHIPAQRLVEGAGIGEHVLHLCHPPSIPRQRLIEC